MRTLLLLFLSLIITTSVQGQILHPVHWSYGSKKISKTEAVVFIRATIDKGWHIYSVNQKDGGPVKTSFVFEPSASYRPKGTVTEPKPVTKYEKTFEMNVNYFQTSVVFQQKVELTSADAVVRGKLNYMTCNDQKCLPPEDVAFEIPIK